MKQFLCTLISITSLFMGMGCDDKDELPAPGYDTIDVSIHAFLQDAEGNDLFNPETTGCINPDNIWIEPGAGTDLTPYFPLQEIPNGSSFGETEQGLRYLGFIPSFRQAASTRWIIFIGAMTGWTRYAANYVTLLSLQTSM